MGDEGRLVVPTRVCLDPPPSVITGIIRSFLVYSGNVLSKRGIPDPFRACAVWLVAADMVAHQQARTGEGGAADVLGRDQHRVSRELGGAALQPLGGQQDHIGMEQQGVSPPRTPHKFPQGFRLGATTNK